MHELKEARQTDIQKFSNLPKEEKSKYVHLGKGSFITKGAHHFTRERVSEARFRNSNRSLVDILLGRNKVSPEELIHEAALREYAGREWDKKVIARDEARLNESWKQYEINKQCVKDGTFPVKKGSLVFRVVGGFTVGSSGPLEEGANVVGKYASPHVDAIAALLHYNDQQQQIYDGSLYDNIQRIAVVRVDDFTIPKPDISHSLAGDRDQVVVSGKVVEVLGLGDFFAKYGER